MFIPVGWDLSTLGKIITQDILFMKIVIIYIDKLMINRNGIFTAKYASRSLLQNQFLKT